ncbi:hypothetical protein [Microbacterium aurantiacum]|uniref:hypothetical protein n=1 Tax=Microbacterium aurantiacum TaxID=162393 RepID=UPI000C80B2C8|nr:hypothetical protein [Microbacterium aurantiacum]
MHTLTTTPRITLQRHATIQESRTPIGSGRSHLAETLVDLAQSADRQAARAVDVDVDVDVTMSSQLFILGDQLRTMAHHVDQNNDRDAALTLLDDARVRVARAMVRLDARERMSATPAPDSVYDVGDPNDVRSSNAAVAP